MDYKTLLGELLGSLRISKKNFADAIGVSPGNVSDWFNRPNARPSIDALRKISETFNVNLNWLVTGEGPMYNNVPARTPEPLIRIDVEASIAAGPPLEVILDPDEPKEQLYIPASLLSLPPPYYAFRVEGDSMSPTLEEGDYVILSRDWREIDVNGRIVGFNTPDGITLKKMVLQPRQKKGWLFPINHQRYDPVEYTKDTPEIIMIGALILSIRKYE